MSPTILGTKTIDSSFSCVKRQRMHEHILSPDGEAKFWIEPVVASLIILVFLIDNLENFQKWLRNMLKKLKKLGKSTLNAEIQNISHQGIWLLVDEQEFFMPFKEFPWFVKATVEQIYNLEFFHGRHLHWPELDIDIDIESLKYPDAYPLKYS